MGWEGEGEGRRGVKGVRREDKEGEKRGRKEDEKENKKEEGRNEGGKRKEEWEERRGEERREGTRRGTCRVMTRNQVTTVNVLEAFEVDGLDVADAFRQLC